MVYHNHGCSARLPNVAVVVQPFFDRVIYYIQQHTQVTDAISVAFLVLQAALYAGAVILVAPKPTSLQVQMDSLAAFSAAEAMRVSHDKTKILLLNC